MTPRTVGLVGAGLIGGSLALAIRQRLPGVRLLAFDRSAETCAQLLQRRAVDAVVPLSELGLAAELVVVAVPPSAVEATFAALRDAPLVTDVVSIKATVAAAAARHLAPGAYVGSHPMAGSERAGLGAATSTLFVGRRVYVCPPADASPAAIATVEALWRAVGALPERTAPDEHDRKMAWVSHGVHAAAAALARAIDTEPQLAGSAGPGLLDTTRVAGGPAELWTEILLGNRAPVLRALDATAASLAELRALLFAGDEAGLRAYLVAAAAARGRLVTPPDEDAEYDE